MILLLFLMNFMHIRTYALLWKQITYHDLQDFKLQAKSNKASTKINNNVEQYLHLRELVQLQKSGASYEELKNASIDGTNSFSATSKKSRPKNKGYEVLLGKRGNLDQRLRAIVAYKKANRADFSEPTSVDEEEVDDASIEDDDDDDYTDDTDTDEETKQLESAVLQIIEANKLRAIKERLEGENLMVSTSDATTTQTKVVDSSVVGNDTAQDLYVPKVPTWGVFPRPQDISRSYGGGKVISREEMKRRDREAEEREQQIERAAQETNRRENLQEQEAKKAIDDALNRAKGFMFMGDGNSAVQVLEKVKENLSWTSEYGGRALLEYGMALEAVGRLDEARSVYGKLASLNLSSGVRKQSVGLISGLDIVKQLKRRMPNDTVVSSTSQGLQLQSIERVLEIGVQSQWIDMNSEDKKVSLKSVGIPDDFENIADMRVTSLKEAYQVLLTAINPLKTVSSSLVIKACRKFFLAPISEKKHYSKSSSSKVDSELKLGYDKAANGTWDLVLSLLDRAPYSAKKFDLGDVRRILNFNSLLATETSSVFWGMSTSSRTVDLRWDEVGDEVVLFGDNLKGSSAPWQVRSRSHQRYQIVFCDDVMKISREKSEEIGGPDLYTLWKRKKESSSGQRMLERNQYDWSKD